MQFIANSQFQNRILCHIVCVCVFPYRDFKYYGGGQFALILWGFQNVLVHIYAEICIQSNLTHYNHFTLNLRYHLVPNGLKFLYYLSRDLKIAHTPYCVSHTVWPHIAQEVTLRATSNMSQEPWPCNGEDPWLASKGRIMGVGEVVLCSHGPSSIVWSENGPCCGTIAYFIGGKKRGGFGLI